MDDGPGPAGSLTAYRLRLARIRAEVTGESVADALRALQGGGRRRPVPTAVADEAAGAAEPAACAGPEPDPIPEAEPEPADLEPEAECDPDAVLARVIPLARAARRRAQDG